MILFAYYLNFQVEGTAWKVVYVFHGAKTTFDNFFRTIASLLLSIGFHSSISSVEGEHTLVKTVVTAKIGGLAKFAKKSATCVGCKTVMGKGFGEERFFSVNNDHFLACTAKIM